MSSLVLQAPPRLLWHCCLFAGLAKSCGHRQSPGGTDGSWGSAEGSPVAAVPIWGMFVKGNWCFEQFVPKGECRSLVSAGTSSKQPPSRSGDKTRRAAATYGTWWHFWPQILSFQLHLERMFCGIRMSTMGYAREDRNHGCDVTRGHHGHHQHGPHALAGCRRKG